MPDYANMAPPLRAVELGAGLEEAEGVPECLGCGRPVVPIEELAHNPAPEALGRCRMRFRVVANANVGIGVAFWSVEELRAAGALDEKLHMSRLALLLLFRLTLGRPLSFPASATCIEAGPP